MSRLFDALRELLAGGGYLLTIPLLLVAVALWALLAERALTLDETPWEFFIPKLRRRRLLVGAETDEALNDYGAQPTAENEEKLLACCAAQADPASLFVRRALAGGPQARRPLRAMLLHGARHLGLRELDCGFGLIRALSRAALLLGALVALSGVERSLWSMATVGVHLESAAREGAPGALLGSQIALVVLIPGLLGQLWLARRAESRRRELESRHRTLALSLEARAEESPSW